MPAFSNRSINNSNSATGMANLTDPRSRQQSTSHILKTGKRGNPFVKDTHDLFSTLVASLQLSTNTRFFRSYPNSFTTDDAAANLASLRFSQSNRSTDPNDPSRIVTTTTTTTFSMNRDIAKGICQHFMDARLIENAADPLNPTFKERGIYQITPKGLHVLERFITKNGIHADHLVRVFTSQPICMKLLHLERRPTDDEIHITPNVIHIVFKRFSGGRQPNYVAEPSDVYHGHGAKGFIDNARLPANFDRSLGIELQDVRERSSTGNSLLIKHVFASTGAIDWLVDFSTCCGREEAAELLAHFVRYGLITLHIDRSKGGDKVAQVNVRAPMNEPRGSASLEGDFRYGSKVIYRITDEGRRLSGSESEGSKREDAGGDASSTHSAEPIRPDPRPSPSVQATSLAIVAESQARGRQVLRDILHPDPSEGSSWVKDATSSTARLKAILDEPALRSLFRDFLRSHICEENLHYWIDVQEFRRRFATSSTAVGVGQSKKKSSATSAMEQHQEKLVSTALLIFNTYLAPGSPSELNIDHGLRGDVISYMAKAVDEVKGNLTPSPDVAMPALRATQVQALLRHYERIADHIYRLMATDQVPKFIRTERFLELLASQQPSNSSNNGDGNENQSLNSTNTTSPKPELSVSSMPISPS
ncbi:regulator of G protein signaling domain-containing protein [Melampsora americana]|nr:regulator of G protein signaling domain-containing protein [Melampsora americana]